jgi:hypothetical protein
MKHLIFEVKVDLKLYASSFGVVTLTSFSLLDHDHP